jgi:dTDP-4-amino-4,6-dideoxygalactose transaminase
MNVWVRVGRAVVFVDPSVDTHNSLDSASRIERAVSAATKAIQAALDNATS